MMDFELLGCGFGSAGLFLRSGCGVISIVVVLVTVVRFVTLIFIRTSCPS